MLPGLSLTATAATGHVSIHVTDAGDPDSRVRDLRRNTTAAEAGV